MRVIGWPGRAGTRADDFWRSAPPTSTGGLTQQALAERASLSVHGIQKLERGATRPYRDTARRLSAALQLNSDEQSRFQEAVSPVRRHGSAAPVSTASDGARHNLPVPVTSLVGREAAMREVEHALAVTRCRTHARDVSSRASSLVRVAGKAWLRLECAT
jgi:transcriptional regulator with XRE-family HTH domain